MPMLIQNQQQLADAILLLNQKRILQEQHISENVVMLKSNFTLKNIVGALFKIKMGNVDVKTNLIGTGAGVLGGMLVKKIFVGSSINPIKWVTGNILQLGLTKLIAQNPEMVKVWGGKLIDLISPKKHKPEASLVKKEVPNYSYSE